MGKSFILVLATNMKRLRFMAMYEQDFVLQWVMSIPAAEELAGRERFEFALVEFDSDPSEAMAFCQSLKKIQPRTRVIFLKTGDTPLPDDFCADLVLEADLSEDELGACLHDYIRMSA
ncbi:MAG: hypothetical protein DMG61_09780 [Acidobacteria bacterium]|nr:MAG: hypothetical protein DMG61_09780 [Acidobacteriota bacterium]PYY18790.1 MAG: hypothetical protein DMG60_07025 [Acidobacteriota bacterium]